MYLARLYNTDTGWFFRDDCQLVQLVPKQSYFSWNKRLNGEYTLLQRSVKEQSTFFNHNDNRHDKQ